MHLHCIGKAYAHVSVIITRRSN